MPNWCSNVLTVTGSKADVELFMQKARGPADEKGNQSPLSFNSIVPMDEKDPDYQDGRENHCETVFNWYRWCIDHWGCKWDIGDDEVSVETSECFDGKSLEAVYSFSTAWCAPIEFYYAITEMFPTLTFSAFGWECGNSEWWSFDGIEGSGCHEQESIDTDSKVAEALTDKLNELGFNADSGDLDEMQSNLCDWYLEEDDLSEIPEAPVVIDMDDDAFIEMAKEYGFKKKRKSTKKKKK
jgi:hypothetical protein